MILLETRFLLLARTCSVQVQAHVTGTGETNRRLHMARLRVFQKLKLDASLGMNFGGHNANGCEHECSKYVQRERYQLAILWIITLSFVTTYINTGVLTIELQQHLCETDVQSSLNEINWVQSILCTRRLRCPEWENCPKTNFKPFQWFKVMTYTLVT